MLILTQESRGTVKDHRFRKNGKNCKYCGKLHAQGRCPAFGKVCTNCHKRNHFAAVCRSEPRVNLLEDVQSDVHKDDFEINCVDYYVASLSSSSKGLTTALRMCDL